MLAGGLPNDTRNKQAPYNGPVCYKKKGWHPYDAILNCINIVFNYYFFFNSFAIAFSAEAFAASSFFCAAASAFALPAALAAFTAS